MLETGRAGPLSRAASAVWSAVAARSLVRRVSGDVAIVAVGGATLGGSGKTSLAIACARALRGEGARVAFVGHAYRARPGQARVVSPVDRLADVGDDALFAARELDGEGVPVVVGPSRERAVAFAARMADVCVVDGLVQTAPRAALSLLAVDPDAPWGAGACPPAGDLRAPVASLVAAVDQVVPLVRGEPRLVAGGRAVDARTLEGRTLGVFTACGHPERVVGAVRALGLDIARVARAPDHGPAPSSLPAVDVWLAAPECALHLEALGVAALALRSDVVLPREVLAALSGLGPAAHSRAPFPTSVHRGAP
jgi:tetraacyldisaccharide 4'-kinase